MASVCIMVMCGLPASGKSTLCKQLHRHLGDVELPYKFIVVEYDELLPPDVEKTLIGAGDGTLIEGLDSTSEWKSYRQDIHTCVDWVISVLDTPDRTLQTEQSWLSTSPIGNIQLWKSFVEKHYDDCMNYSPMKPTCVVIDDNMYYRSMRYSYYQLARKYNTGFCQTYLQTDVGEAIRHNKQRSYNVVSEETIIQMDKRLEEPQPIKNSWEQNTLTLKNRMEINEVLEHHLRPMIEEALSRPVQSLVEVDKEATNQSRTICSASFIHQTDNTIRKLVSQDMVNAKAEGMTKSELKFLAGNLQILRKKIIDDLKSGTMCVPKNVVTTITDASKDESSDLYEFVRQLFNKEKHKT